MIDYFLFDITKIYFLLTRFFLDFNFIEQTQYSLKSVVYICAGQMCAKYVFVGWHSEILKVKIHILIRKSCSQFYYILSSGDISHYRSFYVGVSMSINEPYCVMKFGDNKA